uniref:Ig-like domain-containing protein n=1 Tax=Varanus komodoensis TaxID=61221 RepID=A0A8D2LQ95_VARKO
MDSAKGPPPILRLPHQENQPYSVCLLFLLFALTGAIGNWCFLLLCLGAASQPALTQPSSLSAPLGQTVKISCDRSGGSSWYYFSWYQQKPGQAPRMLIYGDSSRGDGIPARFTGSRSGGTGHLSIANLQADDEADYYCAAWEDSSNMLHSGTFGWGTETKTSALPLESGEPRLQASTATLLNLQNPARPRQKKVRQIFKILQFLLQSKPIPAFGSVHTHARTHV